MAVIRGTYRLLLLLLSVVIGLPVYAALILIAGLFGAHARASMVRALKPIEYGFITWAFGVRLTIRGTLDERAALFVANHQSYLDILIASTVIRGAFISRDDVRNWPVIGLFARVEGTLFLDRDSLRSAVETAERMQERARSGTRLILFPEGGITTGRQVAGFKPLLLRAAVIDRMRVQPVTIAYTHIANEPVTDANQHMILWDDPETQLPPHAWRLLKKRHVRVSVTFHPALDAPESSEKASVREFTAALQERVASGMTG